MLLTKKHISHINPKKHNIGQQHFTISGEKKKNQRKKNWFDNFKNEFSSNNASVVES